MKPILWLSSVSLVSAACTYNYALWVPHDGDTFAQDVGQAIPSLDFDQVEALNPGININKIYPGRTYKVPYDANMEIVPPAAWSSDCPRVLRLNRDTRTEPAGSATSDVASRASSGSTATSTGPGSTATPSRMSAETDTSEHLLSISLTESLEPTATRPTTTISDASTAHLATTAIFTTTATGSHSVSAPEATGTGSPLVCWRETHPEVAGFSSSKESRASFIESFCKRLDNFKINDQHPTEEAPYDDVWIGMQMLPACPNHAIGADHVEVCRRVLGHINDRCIEAGGVFQTGCMLYYFVKLT